MTNWIASRVVAGEYCRGIWLNIGSSLSAEMAGIAGFDWALIDMEHGACDYKDALAQLQAIARFPTAPIVRIAWNDAPRFKRVLDIGPAGVMVPWVNSADEARQAVAAMRYPPEGIRGVARMQRGTAFGVEFDRYFQEANDNLLLAVQIETSAGIEASAEIAKVPGVHCLFVGPLDLSVSLGAPQQFNHPTLIDAMKKVVQDARNAGKAAGILCPSVDDIPRMSELGFTFVAAGSDGGLMFAGMRRVMELFDARQR